jgi:hypothetical protein
MSIVFYDASRWGNNAANRLRLAASGLAFLEARGDTGVMIMKTNAVLLIVMVLLSAAAFQQYAPPSGSAPQYTGDAEIKFPEHYREWVYLTTDST